MKHTRIVSLMLVLVMVVACIVLASCNKKGGVKYEEINVADAYEETREFKSLWDTIADKVDISMVTEKDGLAYATVDGKEYELGMDFLSMAMVYKCAPAGDFKTEDDVYLEWWRLYMQRWNYLMPEVPLYSNQYYDVYSTKIDSLKTGPYWGVASAILYSKMADATAESKFILGSSTELSGEFRYPTWGVSSPAASNNDINSLITGLGTVESNQDGTYVWSDTVVKDHKETVNEDGSKTFEITIKEGLIFSDGTPVKAANYLYATLVFSSPVGKAAMAGMDKKAGMVIDGYSAFKDATEPTAFSGLKLIDEYTFSVTISSDYIPYYYDITYAGFTPQPKELWLPGDADIVVGDDKSVSLNAAFYAKDGDNYALAETIANNRFNYDTIPFSGAYKVASYDADTRQATLVINDKFPGNFEGQKPSIETLVYVKVIEETSVEQLKKGEVNVLAGVTGADETNAAITAVKESNGALTYGYYNRAGYGKLGFRSDFGPAMFAEVRQAVAIIINQDRFCQTFTGGYGSVVYGAYGLDFWQIKALGNKLKLNAYTPNDDEAIAVLVAGGWTYNKEGKEYKEGDGIRYKKLAREEQIANNLTFASKDGAYKTVKIAGEYYMPLVINWFGSSPNPFTEVLKTEFAGIASLDKIGMAVQVTEGNFTALLGEYYQYDGYGYQGPAMYNAFNFATSFSAAAYDFAYNWTIDPDMYEDYSQYYLKDAADFVWAE